MDKEYDPHDQSLIKLFFSNDFVSLYKLS